MTSGHYTLMMISVQDQQPPPGEECNSPLDEEIIADDAVDAGNSQRQGQ